MNNFRRECERAALGAWYSLVTIQSHHHHQMSCSSALHLRVSAKLRLIHMNCDYCAAIDLLVRLEAAARFTVVIIVTATPGF